MTVAERFLKYVAVPTASCAGASVTPSSACQFDLARLLVQELREMGVEQAGTDEQCFTFATLPATPGCEQAPAIGFIAHVDTIPDFPGDHVHPQVIENYDGGDVPLGSSGRVLRPADFPHLAGLKGRTLITTDGTTLLGADDKAGIAIIMTFVQQLLESGNPHGKICIGFTPDEETGTGALHFDVARFGADYAYTLDGGREGDISYETFHAAGAVVRFTGFNVHPGSAKNTMINAVQVASEFNGMLPSGETPRDTEGYEGYFHLCSLHGNVESAEAEYIIRDHDAGIFEGRLGTMRHIAKLLNEKYGAGTVTLEIRPQYRNMAEKIRPCFHLVDTAMEAARQLGLSPKADPIRGGTDGSHLSFAGLPCPNLGTAGYAAHGPYEHVTVEGMETMVRQITLIAEHYARARRDA